MRAGTGGRPVAISGHAIIASTSTPAMAARASSVRVARRFPLTTPPLPDDCCRNPRGFSMLKKNGRLSVGAVKSKIGSRVARSSSAADFALAIRRNRSSATGSHGATRIWKPCSPEMRRIVSPSSLVNGERETSNVAMRSRVTRIMCWLGSARPRSSRDATASDSKRVVSETAPGSYQRDTLKTPAGVSARRKTCHPSRV